MDVPSSKNGQGASFDFLFTQHPITSWPQGACVRVWGGEVQSSNSTRPLSLRATVGR